jgi:hypothetical protein
MFCFRSKSFLGVALHLQNFVARLQPAVDSRWPLRVDAADERPHPVPVFMSGQGQPEAEPVPAELDLNDVAGEGLEVLRPSADVMKRRFFVVADEVDK